MIMKVGIVYLLLFAPMLPAPICKAATVKKRGSTSTEAVLKLPAFIGDNMVLQRDKPVRIWGWAGAGDPITVRIGDEQHTTIATPDGIWTTNLKPKPAGGPYSLVIKTQNESLTVKNILFGDVWICSGQSNMEFPLKNVDNAAQELKEASFPLIRLLQVGKRAAINEASDIGGGKWEECSPQSVPNFSAVAYFFGKELLAHTKIPIGLINVSWGGSAIEAWMSAEMLQNYPAKQQKLKQIASNPRYIQDRETQVKTAERLWLRKFYTETGHLDSAGNLVKQPDAENWVPVTLPGFINDQHAGVCYGVSWYKKTFTIPDGQERNAWELNLGQITESSIIYLNGRKLGASYSRNTVNKFAIPASWIRSGGNELLVYALNETGSTGFLGVTKPELVSSGSSAVISLSGSWLVKQQTVHGPGNLFGIKPPAVFLHGEYTLLYNGLIAPLVKTGITGAIWYQGESNANKPDEYHSLLTDLIKGWKKSWNFPDMPFYIVQLPNYNAFTEKQKALAWPRFQEVQRELAFSLKNSGLAVTYDIGKADNIHPTNKKDVGKRLSLVVRKNLYQDNALVCYGPEMKSVKPEKGSLLITFERSPSPLVNSTNSATLTNFRIAGADGVFYPATAVIRGDQVAAFSPDVLKPVFIRYAFDCNPIDVNFYNAAGLPAIPFRTDDLKEWLDK